MNAVIRSFVLCLALGLGASADRTPSAAVASERTAYASIRMIPLRVGDRVTERAYQNDRIDWKLPARRLEHFRATGVVIDEERHIASLSEASVVEAGRSGAVLRVHSRLTSFDVPRDQLTATSAAFDLRLAPDNQPRPDQELSVADGATVGLPFTGKAPGHLGQRWRTHLAVVTTLGKGDAIFEHEVVGFENGLAEISVWCAGKITGAQYHLPKLLPGTIQCNGTAWYDPRSGLITQESYAIHNRLLKPAEGEQIGFDERLTLDSTTRLTPRGQGPG